MLSLPSPRSRRRHELHALALAVAIAVFLIEANPARALGDELVALGRWGEGTCLAVAVEGTLAFSGNGAFLEVVDIGQPNAPALLGRILLPEGPKSITANGDHAYVAAGGAGLQIVDVSAPATPTLAGVLEVEGTILDVAVSGDHAYLADQAHGLRIVDVSNPAAPAEVGFYDTGFGPQGVAVSGVHAFLAERSGGVRVIDISDPTSPTQIGQAPALNQALHVAVSGDHLYVANFTDGLVVLDVSDPTTPTQVGSAPGVVYYLAVDGARLYAAVWKFSGRIALRVYDISSPASPMEVGDVEMEGNGPGRVAAAGDQALIASPLGLHIAEVAPGPPAEIGFHDTGSLLNAVAVSGAYAYLANDVDGLRILDVSDPASPSEVGLYDTGGVTLGVAVAGDYAYLADDEGGLQVVDVSNPAAPASAGALPIDRSLGVAIAAGYGYLVTLDHLHVVDVSNPNAPMEIGSVATGFSSFQYVAVSGDHAYVAANGGGFAVIDVSNPAAPAVVGSLATGNALGVAVGGQVAYVSGSPLKLIDVSDPTDPMQIGEYNQASSGVAVEGDHAYVGVHAGLVALDVTDPTAPSEAAFYPLPVENQALAAAGGLVWLGGYENGLWIFHHNIAQPVLLSSFTAERRRDGDVVVRWEVAFESGAAGFHVHRQEPGRARTPLTPALLPVRDDGGRRYEFIDATPPLGAATYWLEEVAFGGARSWVASAAVDAADGSGTRAAAPLRLALPEPHPWRAPGILRYELGAPGHVALDLFDARGRLVRRLVEGTREGGPQAVAWNGRDAGGRRVPAGVYVLRLSAGGTERAAKLVLAR